MANGREFAWNILIFENPEEWICMNLHLFGVGFFYMGFGKSIS